MEAIDNSVLDYINSENTLGALQIDGPWGCGKTYYIKNKLLPLIEKNETDREKERIREKRIPLMISLFGIKNIDDISRQLLFASTQARFSLPKKRIKDIKQTFSNIAKFIPYLNKIDWEKMLQIPPSMCLKLLGGDAIIILDDLERLSEDIKIEDVLGFVNDLVENNKFKVILVSNQGHLKEKSQLFAEFKEKVIDKTIPFDIDTFSIIKSMAEQYHALLPSFLESDCVVRYLSYDTPDAEHNRNLSNLRIVRFALSQFCPFFKHFIGSVNKFENIPNDIIKKLCIIWRFTLAIAIEYRLGNISLDKPNQLENAGFNYMLNRYISDQKQQEVGEEKEPVYEEKFIERYYEPFDITYLFIPDVYNYVLRGGKISFESVDEIVSKDLGIWEEPMNPELSYVCKFFGRISHLSDEEARGEFLKFIDLISKGHVEKLATIINAANLLFSYKEVFEFSVEEIENQIIKGIDMYLSKTDDESIKNQEHELETYFQDIREEVRPCLAYVYEKIRQQKEISRKEYAKVLNEKFRDNMEDFAKEFVPYQDVTKIHIRSNPILHLMNLQLVENKVKTLTSYEVGKLYDMLYYRFRDGSFVYPEEKTFIAAIQNGLSTLSDDDTSLSAHVKRVRLVPLINKLSGS